jgi:phosphate transport system protein
MPTVPLPETSRPVKSRLLIAEVIRMGGLAEAQVVDAIDALVRRDVPLAQALIVRDLRLDALQGEIERDALALIGAAGGEEIDIRCAVAAMKMALNLERCGDLARNIAKRSLLLAASEPVLPLIGAVDRLGRLVSAQLRQVLDAYAAQDLAPALAVWRRDGEIDERHEALSRELLVVMAEAPDQVAVGAHLLFIAKNLERIGDHATNIAEILHFQVTGEAPEGERPKRSLADAEAPGTAA